MTVGTIAYACHSGLGHLARDFYRHGLVDRVLVHPHPKYGHSPEEFYGKGYYDKDQVDEFLDNLDTLLLFETAVGNTWNVVAEAKRRGARVVVMPMYEWTPDMLPVPVDLWLCPSLLDVDYFKGQPHVFLPVPVEVPWKLRETAISFVHNAGHLQRQHSKGTLTVLEAFRRHVQSQAKLTVRLQPGEQMCLKLHDELMQEPLANVSTILDELPEGLLYAHGDVFINAEEYNGLSLPLQEAYASGMMVMTTDRYPANTWLPKEPLIPVHSYRKDRIVREFDRAVVAPEAVAATVDRWYGERISSFSMQGRQWAEMHSWDRLKPKYEEVLR